jgi:hypothetical protein
MPREAPASPPRSAGGPPLTSSFLHPGGYGQHIESRRSPGAPQGPHQRWQEIRWSLQLLPLPGAYGCRRPAQSHQRSGSGFDQRRGDPGQRPSLQRPLPPPPAPGLRAHGPRGAQPGRAFRRERPPRQRSLSPPRRQADRQSQSRPCAGPPRSPLETRQARRQLPRPHPHRCGSAGQQRAICRCPHRRHQPCRRQALPL